MAYICLLSEWCKIADLCPHGKIYHDPRRSCAIAHCARSEHSKCVDVEGTKNGDPQIPSQFKRRATDE